MTSVAPGDHVVTSFLPACGHCRFCAAGRSNLCDKGATIAIGQLPSGTYPFRLDGEPLGGFCMVGAFAQHSLLSEFSCVRIEPHVPLDTAALVACSVPTGWGSAVYSGGVRPGDTVVVVGLGGVGVNAVQGAVHAGRAERRRRRPAGHEARVRRVARRDAHGGRRGRGRRRWPARCRGAPGPTS